MPWSDPAPPDSPRGNVEGAACGRPLFFCVRVSVYINMRFRFSVSGVAALSGLLLVGSGLSPSGALAQSGEGPGGAGAFSAFGDGSSADWRGARWIDDGKPLPGKPEDFYKNDGALR